MRASLGMLLVWKSEHPLSGNRSSDFRREFPTNDRLINQIVGAGTSVGANFCEANDCVSKKDFRNTVKRCIKESKETRFFLRMIVASEPTLAAEARKLYREATELTRILATMYRK